MEIWRDRMGSSVLEGGTSSVFTLKESLGEKWKDGKEKLTKKLKVMAYREICTLSNAVVCLMHCSSVSVIE